MATFYHLINTEGLRWGIRTEVMELLQIYISSSEIYWRSGASDVHLMHTVQLKYAFPLCCKYTESSSSIYWEHAQCFWAYQRKKHISTFSLTTIPFWIIFALSFWYRKYLNNGILLGSIISNKSTQRATIS